MSNEITVAVLLSLIAVANLFLVNSILDKLTSNKESITVAVFKSLIILFLAFSFSQIYNLITVEPFSFGLLTILLFWNYYLKIRGKELNLQRFSILIGLGILSISMVTTNYVHFFIGTFCLFVFTRKKNWEHFFGDCLIFVVINALVLTISYHLCNLQVKLFPSSVNGIDYFIDTVKDFVFGTTTNEEVLYTVKGGSFGILNIITSAIFSFGFSFFGYKIGYIWNHWINFFTIRWYNKLFAFVIILLLIYSIALMFKNKKFTIIIPFLGSLGFEILFHSLYGNDTLMLYSILSTGTIPIVLYSGLSELKNKKVLNVFSGIITILLSLCLIFNTFSYIEAFKNFDKYYVPLLSDFWGVLFATLFQYLIIIGAILIFTYLIKNKNKDSIQNEQIEENDIVKEEVVEKNSFVNRILSKIKSFIDLIKNKLSPRRFMSCVFLCVSVLTIVLQGLSLYTFRKIDVRVNARRNAVKIYLYNEEQFSENKKYTIIFGMGLRNKFLIEKESENPGSARIYKYWPSIKWKDEILRKITVLEYDSVNYTAKLRNEETKEILYMYENEDGVYLKNGNKITVLDESQHINIPTFEEYEHPDYMRAAFGEMMVNITQKGVVPNILFFGETYWYKHTAMVAMALEKTGNLSQILPMINSITPAKIYDYARNGNVAKNGIQHIDNLGQVLYLMSLLDKPKQNVVNAVLTEVKKYEKNNPNVSGKKYIEALTDGYAYPAFQTKWLKFGMDSLGIDSSAYDVKGLTDWYHTSCWFYEKSTKNKLWMDLEVETEKLFNHNISTEPFITWGVLHAYQAKIELPENIVYPLTHSGKISTEGYSITHSHTASEMLLYLFDWEDYT
ncbi:MAG: hypothetical protein IKB06_03255 [Clostridia bacterium]|nr:hypothetical protein [Clostridia bacterium]